MTIRAQIRRLIAITRKHRGKPHLYRNETSLIRALWPYRNHRP